MSELYTPPSATLLYGMGGAGKTPLAISAFWDWKTQTLLGNGITLPRSKTSATCRQGSAARLRNAAPAPGLRRQRHRWQRRCCPSWHP